MWALVVAPYDRRLFYHLGGLRSPIFALLHRETYQFESRQRWSHRFDNIRRYLVHSTLYVGSAWLSSTFRWHQCLNSWTILVTWLKDLAEWFAQINWSLYENCGKLRVKSASFSTDNDQTLRLFTLYCISNHKNFIPKHLDNALTDFA